jgi:hypothetical protein
MNEVQAYSRAYEKNRLSKRLQQISYSLSKLEQRFRIDDLSTDELISLIASYDIIFRESIELLTELQNDQENE